MTKGRPANLQKGISVEQAAKIMNVSVRSVYSAKRVCKLAEEQGRPEIVQAVEAGRLSLNAALIELEGKRTPDRLKALRRAWEAASEEERHAFLDELIAAKPDA